MTARSPFGGVLDALIRQRGVLGSLVVSEADGIIVDSNLSIGINGATVAALAASLYRKARLSSRAAELGEATFFQLEAERGRVCAVGRNDLVIVTVAETRANVGLIRMEMLRAMEVLG
jgi:predicted regulator of Ras-like GTPase activity (Roadblock/LC7/MglB family)